MTYIPRKKEIVKVLTQDILKRYLVLKEDGQLYWAQNKGTAKKGDLAGTIKATGKRYICICGQQWAVEALRDLYLTGEPLLKKPHQRSQFKGVCYLAQVKRWKSTYSSKGISTYLGVFKSEIEARDRYNEYVSTINEVDVGDERPKGGEEPL